jgi:hypothetical protein
LWGITCAVAISGHFVSILLMLEPQLDNLGLLMLKTYFKRTGVFCDDKMNKKKNVT